MNPSRRDPKERRQLHQPAGAVELVPAYDRNPQAFVQNIFWARPEDYKKATQRI